MTGLQAWAREVLDPKNPKNLFFERVKRYALEHDGLFLWCPDCKWRWKPKSTSLEPCPKCGSSL